MKNVDPMENISSLSSYLNPFSESYHKATVSFDRMALHQKVLTVFLTAITSLVFIVPGVVVYRCLVEHFTKQIARGEDPVAARIHEVAEKILIENPPAEDMESSINKLHHGLEMEAVNLEKEDFPVKLNQAVDSGKPGVQVRTLYEVAVWCKQISNAQDTIKDIEACAPCPKEITEKFRNLSAKRKELLEKHIDLIQGLFREIQDCIAELPPNEIPEALRMDYKEILNFIRSFSKEKVESAIKGLDESYAPVSPEKTSLIPPTLNMLSTPKGISNIGNSCYLNSCLQAILHTKLANYIKHDRGDVVKNEQAHQDALSLFQDVYDGTNTDLKLRDAAYILREVAFSNTRIATGFATEQMTQQQDAAQMMGALLQSTGCEFKEKIITEAPGKIRQKVESGHLFSLGMDGTEKDLTQILLNNHIEEINDEENQWVYEQDGVSERITEYSRKRVFAASPPVLVLQLNRFTYTGLTPIKINTKITIPDEIDLADFMEGRDGRYRVAAYINHHGSSAGSGHYTANVKVNGDWVCCNDSSVSKVADAIEKEAREHAYLIVLEKVD